jgi:hypothetical protein
VNTRAAVTWGDASNAALGGFFVDGAGRLCVWVDDDEYNGAVDRAALPALLKLVRAAMQQSVVLPPATTTDRYAALSYLQPKFRAKVEALLARMHELGHDAVVWETFRTRARNLELSARGTGI